MYSSCISFSTIAAAPQQNPDRTSGMGLLFNAGGVPGPQKRTVSYDTAGQIIFYLWVGFCIFDNRPRGISGHTLVRVITRTVVIHLVTYRLVACQASSVEPNTSYCIVQPAGLFEIH